MFHRCPPPRSASSFRLSSSRKNILSSGGIRRKKTQSRSAASGTIGRRVSLAPSRSVISLGYRSSDIIGFLLEYRYRSPLLLERHFHRVVPFREFHGVVGGQALLVQEIVDRRVGVGEGVVHEPEGIRRLPLGIPRLARPHRPANLHR